MFSTDDTITAIATPAGRGGIGVVRLSGPLALAIAGRLLDRGDDPLVPRHATFAKLRGVDHVVCTFFPAPQSYTGEDVVEISAHGSPVVLARIIEHASRSGARLARPGEFTFRAYLNGRIDLVQAEAVADLVDAVTPAQASLAFAQLDGTLTEALRDLRERLFELVVRLEASLDFPEEDYHFISRRDLEHHLHELESRIDGLLEGAAAGRVIREGALVVISGRPNVGKSSLFNALLGAGRAIVTATPGTTRDLLTERCDVEGIPVTFVDTAGMRSSADEIEREGVERARRAGEMADLRLLVLDRSASLNAEDEELLGATEGTHRLVVANKADLPAAWDPLDLKCRYDSRLVEVSARTGAGVDALKRATAIALAGSEPGHEIARVTNVRHVRLLEEARAAVNRACRAACEGATEEFVLADVFQANRLFDQIVRPGASSPEAVLEAIFARFCIGK